MTEMDIVLEKARKLRVPEDRLEGLTEPYQVMLAMKDWKATPEYKELVKAETEENRRKYPQEVHFLHWCIGQGKPRKAFGTLRSVRDFRNLLGWIVNGQINRKGLAIIRIMMARATKDGDYDPHKGRGNLKRKDAPWG